MKNPLKTCIPALLLALSMPIWAQANVIQSLPMDGYAAVVNERVITIGEVMLSTYEAQERLQLKYSGEALNQRREELFYTGLERLIDNALIIEEFGSIQGQIPDRAIDDRINTIVHENFNGDRSALLDALARDGITLEEWRKTIRERIIVGAMRQNEIGARVVISPKQIVDAYDAAKDSYEQPEQVKLRLIFIRSGDDPEAAFQEVQEARQNILNGASFDQVAKDVSDDASAALGGDWGMVEAGQLREDFRDAIEGLAEGGVSEPVFTTQGYYLLQVEERQEAYMKDLQEVRTEIENRLSEAESERLYQAWMERLRQKHSVLYFIPRPVSTP